MSLIYHADTFLKQTTIPINVISYFLHFFASQHTSFHYHAENYQMLHTYHNKIGCINSIGDIETDVNFDIGFLVSQLDNRHLQQGNTLYQCLSAALYTSIHYTIYTYY